MKYIKLFEGFFRKSDNPKSIRISLNEQSFAKLCQTGEVEEGGSKFTISKENFTKLIEGDIIKVDNAEICLSDIGWVKIGNYAVKSIYKK